MRFNEVIEFLFNRQMYSQIQQRLISVGGTFLVLSLFISGPAKVWVEEIASLQLMAAFVFLLAGTVAERRERQAKQKAKIR